MSRLARKSRTGTPMRRPDATCVTLRFMTTTARIAAVLSFVLFILTTPVVHHAPHAPHEVRQGSRVAAGFAGRDRLEFETLA